MTRRWAAALLAATLALFAALHLLVRGLYRGAARTVDQALAERLEALGRTAARAVATLPRDADAAAFLRGVVDDNRLEDAYLVSAALTTIAGARGRGPLNLMRLDPARLERALAGAASVDRGYSVGEARVESGYFPVARAAGRAALVLEAGREFHAPAARLRVTYGVASALAALLAALFAGGLYAALRALERARLSHGRAERLAATGQMAAMVAHEVRNPLGILRGHLELLRERLRAHLDERARGRIEEMMAEVDRLARLTGEFLSLAREVPLERAPCDLAALAADVAAAVRADAPDARVVVAVDGSLALSADADKLRQVLLNLVLNAVQAAPGGVEVRVEGRRAGAGIELVVRDDGPGVPPELRDRIFDPFVGARPGGSGLGLAICRRIVEQHGGTLTLAATAPGARGAAFVLRLPKEKPWRAS